MIQCLPSHVSWQDYTAGLSSGTLGISHNSVGAKISALGRALGKGRKGKEENLELRRAKRLSFLLVFFTP